MFDIKTDRLNYGDLLTPPPEYELNKAIATTYSLDFEILTAACIALGLNEATDSILTSNKICAFNAIENVSKKLLVFCEAGQVSLPDNLSILHQLFEKSIVPVALPKKPKSAIYPSFHPKMWLLEYKKETGGKVEYRYRFIVMSRNLTSDRSWDVSVMLEGKKEEGYEHKVRPLLDFLDFLKGEIKFGDSHRKQKKEIISEMIKSVEGVHFVTSDGGKPFSDFEIIPIGIKGHENVKNEKLFNGSSYEDILVISPFLTRGIIELLNNNDKTLKETNRCVLITRKTELPKIRDVISRFDVYVVKDDIVYGENNLPEGDDGERIQTQDIHAKMYLWRKYSETYLYIGSMNASERGTGIYPDGNETDRPVNVELMLKLVTMNRYLNLQSFRDELLDDDRESAFMKISDEDIIENSEGDDNRNKLLQLIKKVCRLNLHANVSCNNGVYDVEVLTANYDIPKQITIAPLYAPRKERLLESEISFNGLELRELSELYKIKAEENGEYVEKIILIPTGNIPVEREGNIIKYVISTKREFAEYVAFLLGDDYMQTMSEIIEEENGKGKKDSRTSAITTSLYERMLTASCNNPQRLLEISKVVETIDDDTIVSDTFRKTYNTFMEALDYGRGRNR